MLSAYFAFIMVIFTPFITHIWSIPLHSSVSIFLAFFLIFPKSLWPYLCPHYSVDLDFAVSALLGAFYGICRV